MFPRACLVEGSLLCGGGGHSDSGLDELPSGYTMSAVRGESCRLTTAVEHLGHEAQKSWTSSFFFFIGALIERFA